MPFTTFGGNLTLDILLRGQTYGTVRVFVALHTADPTVDGDQAEVTTDIWPSYLRVDPSLGGSVVSGFDPPASKLVSNALLMTFPAFDAIDDVVITHVSVWDAVTDGNCLFYDQLEAPITVSSTDSPIFRPGQFEVEMDAP